MGTGLQRNRHSPPVQLSPVLLQEQQAFDRLLDEPPIPGPKPWSDELERAAVAACAYATPHVVALRSYGVSNRSAYEWLSDEPPAAYRSACLALAARLKNASSWCERSLLARIVAAGSDPKTWQANAWILERSKSFSQQYIAVEAQGIGGPSTVVNIGTLNVVQGERPRISWRDDTEVIDTPALAASLVVEDKA